MSTESTWRRILCSARERGQYPSALEAQRDLVQAIADEIDAVRAIATSKLQEAVKLANEALDLIPHVRDELDDYHGISRATYKGPNTNDAEEAIRRKLEALETNA